MQLQQNAFLEFFKCLKRLLEVDGTWDKKDEHIFKAVKNIIGQMLIENNNLQAIIDLALAQKSKKKIGKITLTEAVAMKNYCDLYFWKKAGEFLNKKK